MQPTTVIGAGLVGSLLAILLAKKGHQVDVFERRPDLREIDLKSGRSINLTLCDRGLRVLDSIGIGSAVRELAVPVYGRFIHDVKGASVFQPYGNNNEAIHSISRSDLNKVLLDFASSLDINFHFNEKCLDVDLANATVEMKNLQSDQRTQHRADRIFGADGAHSVVRLQMQNKTRLNFSQQYWKQGYKELDVSATANDGWAAEKNVIHIWPRGDYMLIGFPNIDGSFTCSLHIPFDGPLSFASLRTEEALRKLFDESFPDVVPLMPNLAEDFFTHPANPMVTIKCSPWSYQGKVALIGDAAHSIYPSYGQGANAGFEDCAVLSDYMEQYGDDWDTLLRELEKERKPNTDAIADLCVEHFVELRDLVGDPEFLLRKEVERKINGAYPHKYKDLYSMITFTCMPYTEALRRDREQRTLIDRVMALEDIGQKLHSAETERFIAGLMSAQR
jgi:kynurenine 3-monooxygenase